MDILTVDQLGRVQLPANVREQLGLADSTQLKLAVQDGKIILEPLLQQPQVYYEGKVLVVQSEPTGSLDMINDLREERITEQISG